jgi:hypothetical protein
LQGQSYGGNGSGMSFNSNGTATCSGLTAMTNRSFLALWFVL